MVVDRETIDKIKDIIEKHFNALTISLVGNSAFTPEELKRLEDAGIDTSNTTSLLEILYYNHILNESGSPTAPISVAEAKKQQVSKPKGDAHEAVEEHLNENFQALLDKLKADTQTKFEGLIRTNNNDYRNDALQNLDRPDYIDKLVKESTLGKLKQTLRDLKKEVGRDFKRIAVTEISNAIGLGAADRIVIDNKDKPLEEVYVYRIPVVDEALCRFCREFYLDSDGSPKVYRMSTLLKNGSNYGKKNSDWKPVVTATHPNERCSGILELRPGWKVNAGGSVEFIGYDKWPEYIKKKVTA